MYIFVCSLPPKAAVSPPFETPPAPQRGDQLSTVSCLAFCVEMSILVGQRNLRWGRRGGGVAGQSWMAGSPKERTQADWLWWLTSHSAGANGFGGPALRKPAGKLQREDSAAASAGASCTSSNVLRFYSSVRLGSPLRTSTVANSFISKSRLMAYPDSVDFLYTLSGKKKNNNNCLRVGLTETRRVNAGASHNAQQR